jgi:hypothetical protein
MFRLHSFQDYDQRSPKGVKICLDFEVQGSLPEIDSPHHGVTVGIAPIDGSPLIH